MSTVAEPADGQTAATVRKPADDMPTSGSGTSTTAGDRPAGTDASSPVLTAGMPSSTGSRTTTTPTGVTKDIASTSATPTDHMSSPHLAQVPHACRTDTAEC